MRKCNTADLAGLLEFYKLVIRETDKVYLYARWEFGKHPTEEAITDYLRQGMMYVLEEGQEIAAAVAVTPWQTEEYHDIDWQEKLKDDETAVVHILAVNPHFQNRGYAKKVMEEVIHLSEGKGLKAVRLDALTSNIPAHRLYESLGFKKRDIRHWFAENTGWTDFYLYEYLLQS